MPHFLVTIHATRGDCNRFTRIYWADSYDHAEELAYVDFPLGEVWSIQKGSDNADWMRRRYLASGAFNAEPKPDA